MQHEFEACEYVTTVIYVLPSHKSCFQDIDLIPGLHFCLSLVRKSYFRANIFFFNMTCLKLQTGHNVI